MTAAGFRKMLACTGEISNLGFPVHPHMLRHGCGYKLANDGQATRAIRWYAALSKTFVFRRAWAPAARSRRRAIRSLSKPSLETSSPKSYDGDEF
jgi:hypothetical protein